MWLGPLLKKVTALLALLELVTALLYLSALTSFNRVRTGYKYVVTSSRRRKAVVQEGSRRFDVLEAYIFTGVRGARGTSWRRFKHSEPQRTFSNDTLTELARYLAFFRKRSGWFDCTEPSPPNPPKDQRTTSNLLRPQDVRGTQVCSVLSPEVRVVRPYRTSSSYSVTERKVEAL